MPPAVMAAVGIPLLLAVIGLLALLARRGPARTGWFTPVLPGSAAILRELARLDKQE